MPKSILKIALRFFTRNSLFTGINALGLSIALAASFLIAIYVINELSFDHCHKRYRRIFRIVVHQKYINNNTSFTPFPLAVSLREAFPQIEKLARIGYISGLQVNTDAEPIEVFPVLSADPEIFDIFTIPLIRGTSTKDVLADRNSLVIDEKLAEKLFPGQNPVGKEIAGRIGNTEQNFIVTGVFKDLPFNSTLQASCFVNIIWSVEAAKSYADDPETSWDISNWNTWILLSDKINAGSMDAGLKKILDKLPLHKSADQFSLQNLADVYLHSDILMVSGPVGDIKTIRLLLAVALVILLIAITNYVILSTAVSMSRAKETGIRKTFGATNADIRNQVMTESLLMVVLVLPLALFFVWVALPYTWLIFNVPFRMIIGSNILVYIPVCLFLTFVTGVVSGLYTAEYLTRLNVLDIFKNTLHSGPRKRYFQRALVVIQLFIFCTLTACTLVIYRQYRYATGKDPGYHKKDILFIYLNGIKENASLADEIRNCPEVIMCAMAMNEMPLWDQTAQLYQDMDRNEEEQPGCYMTVHYHFLETMGLTFVQGRDFSEEFGTDMKDAVILNEKAVKMFSLADPLGRKWQGKTIIGIVKDFNCYSVRYGIPSMVIKPDETNLYVMAVHYKPGTKDSLVPKLEAAWKRIDPDSRLSFTTIEDQFSYIYMDQKRLALTLSIFSFLVLLIAASGLFGLTLYISRTRTKETGIKKVLGSTSRSLLIGYLLEHVGLVLAATSLSIPATLYFMNRWVRNFADRIEVTWWIFVITFSGALVIVMITVFYHSWKASRINPVMELRNE